MTTLAASGCRRRGTDATEIHADRTPRQVESERTGILQPSPLAMIAPAPEHPPDQCQLGETRPCFPPGTIGPSMDPAANARYRKRCVRGWDGALRFSNAACNTPLVVSFDADASISFTRPEGGIAFPIGAVRDTEWISGATPWLAIDRDGSGCIEGVHELFGPPPRGGGTNGFASLAELDDNHDGHVDASDPSFASLVLWFDRDQDKRCTSSELRTLAEAGVDSLDLAYRTLAHDEAQASYEGEEAAIWFHAPGGTLRRGRLVDVYLEGR